MFRCFLWCDLVVKIGCGFVRVGVLVCVLFGFVFMVGIWFFCLVGLCGRFACALCLFD